MGLLMAVLRIVAVLFLVRLVLRAFLPLFRQPQAPAPPAKAGELVRDPVCKTFVPRESAVRALVGGREQLYCSSACADRARLGS